MQVRSAPQLLDRRGRTAGGKGQDRRLFVNDIDIPRYGEILQILYCTRPHTVMITSNTPNMLVPYFGIAMPHK